jgi:CRP-like cAMP-binding protein
VDTSSFFTYPDSTTRTLQEDLTFLAEWSNDAWAKLLAHTETRRFRAGSDAISAGETDRALYIVVSGVLEVVVPTQPGRPPRVLATIEPGSVMGEVAFLDGGPRSATVRAGSDGEMIRLSYDAFKVFAAREPELAQSLLLDLSRIVSARLRRSNDRIRTRPG